MADDENITLFTLLHESCENAAASRSNDYSQVWLHRLGLAGLANLKINIDTDKSFVWILLHFRLCKCISWDIVRWNIKTLDSVFTVNHYYDLVLSISKNHLTMAIDSKSFNDVIIIWWMLSVWNAMEIYMWYSL